MIILTTAYNCENNKKYEADEYDNYGDLVLFV